MLYPLYNAALTLGFFLCLPLLPLFYVMGRRFRRGFFQRLGFYPREIRESVRGYRPIWIHAVSVGEVLAARQLVAQLKTRFSKRKIVLSTFTSAGKEVARQSVGADLFVFLPLDHPWVVRRALAVFDPCLLIVLETEIWPNFLRLSYERGIPILLLSGRLSPRSFRYYFFFRRFFGRVVRYFTAMGMQSGDDAGRMTRLGVDSRRISVTGNLKRASASVKGKRAGGRRPHGFPEGRDARQVLVAGSTHRGEEEVLLDAFLLLKSQFPDLVMVLAPRHPQRFAEVERLLRKRRVSYGKRSQMNGRAVEVPDVIFLDTLGELATFYSAADIAFVGGSLVDAGGHNVMEPASFRKPVLFGPYMANFAEIAEEMKRSGGAIEVCGKDELVSEASRLLSEPATAKRAGEFAYRVVQRDRRVLQRSIELVSRYF